MDLPDDIKKHKEDKQKQVKSNSELLKEAKARSELSRLNNKLKEN